MLFFQLPWIPERLLLSKRAISGFMATRSAPELAEAEMKAMQQPGTLKAALNWYRGMPFSSPRETRKKGHRSDAVRLERRRHRAEGEGRATVR